MRDIIILLVFAIGVHTCVSKVIEFFEGFKNIPRKSLRYIGLDCNFPFDPEYDNLIRKIISEGEPISLNRYSLSFELKGVVYNIWIDKEHDSYGSQLFVVGCPELNIYNKGISFDTAILLREKELVLQHMEKEQESVYE